MDAAALQQHLKPRPQAETNQDPAAWMRRQLRNPWNSANLFAHALDNKGPHSRASRPHQTLIYNENRSHPALKVGGMDAADRAVVRSKNRGGRMPPVIAKPLRPGRAAHE